MDFFNNYKINILKIVKILFLIFFIYIFIVFLGKYLSPLIFGYLLCIILLPIYKFFKKLKIPNFLNGILCISILIFIISVVIAGIAGQVIKEAKGFSNELPYYINQVKEVFKGLHLKIFNLLDIFPNVIKDIFNSFYENSKFFISEFLGNGLTNTSVKVIKKIPNIFLITILSIISCFFILIDKKNIDDFILRQIPKKYLEKFNIVKSGILKAIFGYIKAQLIIMILIGTICFIGLAIINVPYALLMGFVIGIIDALPFFGSGFILWPWCAYNIIISNYGTAISLIIIYIVIIITRQFLEPKIIGKQIGLHPLVTLMSIYVGIKIFGIFGFIIGPFIIIIIKILQTENILPKWR